MTRRRLTWNDRKASAPPAMPGYQEPSNHPAAYPDPEADAYENGDTSSWAEDPTKGPYPNSFHPALPGTEETQGHPATDPKHYFPAGVTKQAALQIRKAAELKAAKCIRISQAMLGKKASVQAIEDQALDLMSLNERQIQAALKRVADGMTGADLMAVDNMTLTPPREACGETAEEKMLAEMMVGEEPEADEQMLAEMLAELKAEEAPKAEEQMLAEMLADEGTTDADEALLAQIMADEQKKCAARKRAGEDQNDPDTYKSEEDPKAGKKSEEDPKADEATKKASHYKRLAAYWAKVAAEEPKEDDEDPKTDEDPKVAKKADEDPKKSEGKSEEKAEEDPKKDEEDPKAGKKSAAKKLIAGLNLSDEVKAELAALLADDAPPVEEAPKAEEVPPAEEPVACGEPMSDDFLMDDMGMDDPLMDVPVDDELAILYGNKVAAEDPKEGDEDPKTDDDEPKTDEKKSGKTAAVKPQPRKPSTGAKTIGSVSKTASSEMDDLSKLWASAPDVSKIFG